MTLRHKVALIIGAAVGAVLLLIYLIARIILLHSYTDLEQTDTRRNLERASNALSERMDYLATTTTDWAHWDDTYVFIQDQNEAYIDANLSDETFANLGINLMILADNSGEIVYGKAFDLIEQEEVDLPEELAPHLTPAELLLTNGTATSERHGIIMLPGGPMVVAARPILTSAKEGPSRGTLIFGYQLDDTQVARLAHATRLSLTLTPWEDAKLPGDVRSALSAASPMVEHVLSKHTVAGYVLLSDLQNHPALVMQVDLPREIYARGQSTLGYFMIGITVLSIITGIALTVLIEKTLVTAAQMGALLEHTSDVIILMRPDGTIRQVNSAFKRMFGSSGQPPTGQPIANLFDETLHPKISEAFRAVVEKREDRQIDVTAGRNGSRMDASAALSPIRSSSGQLSGVLCSLRDITTFKHMETQLRQMLAGEMELSQLRSRLISVVSHELRTPLSSIQLAEEYLLSYGNRMPEPVRKEKLAQISASVRQMSNLIEDILNFSRTESGQLNLELSYFDMVELCQMTIETIKASSGQVPAFRFTHQSVCADVYLDQRLLNLIVSNLLSNAVKYSPPNGMVYVDVQCDDERTVLRVRDEGIGIAVQDQERVFEPFFRGQNVGSIAGTGLGLVIVKQAVEMHGGTITFESSERTGTTFTLTFPHTYPATQARSRTLIGTVSV